MQKIIEKSKWRLGIKLCTFINLKLKIIIKIQNLKFWPIRTKSKKKDFAKSYTRNWTEEAVELKKLKILYPGHMH